MDIDRFLSLLRQADKDFTNDDKIFFKAASQDLLLLLPKVDTDNRALLLAEIQSHGFTEVGFKAIVLLNLLSYLTKNIEHLASAFKIARTVDFDLKSVTDMLYTFSRHKFIASYEMHEAFEQAIPREGLIELHRKAVDKLEQLVKDQNITIKDHFEDNNRVVIMVYQFLNYGHAPTKLAIQYADDFLALGKEVLIVNCSEHIGGQTGPAFLGDIPNFLPELTGRNTIDINNNRYDFFQASDEPSPRNFIESINVIEDFDPAIICTIGNKCITSEVFSRRAFCFMVPLLNDLPTTMNNYIFCSARIPSKSWDQMDKYGLRDLYMFNICKTKPMINQNVHYSRSDFNLPEDKFIVMISGNRLQYELNSQNLSMLNAIVSHEKIHLFFLGEISNIDDYFNDYPAIKSNYTHEGYNKEILALFDLCDLFVNLPRSGGGSTTYYAAQKNLPVLGISFGDGMSYVCNADEQKSLDDVVKMAHNLVDNPDKLADAQKQCRVIIEEHISHDEFMHQIMSFYDTFKVRRLGA